ncbi:hypothetical protein [Providencia rettgeri]|uniref:phage tail fiber protein n=1 Tax=Providencia rettgeri TaxID=587 RepID=UPI001D0D061A|nr:hypothetical protein [Providencia rettgeri]UDQ65860.1 hypothetical protein LHK11_11845 [Providencia rettgeri]
MSGYNIGTVTTTANSTKLVGTGTKWLNNINRVSAEQAIQIQIGTTVHNNSIQSIQSDTELTLNFPLPTAATGAKYVILTTMVHSVSDAMNKIVSMNGANVQFSDILTRWMTEQGIITVTLPDQTTQQLRTTKEMDKQLDGKFDKAGGTLDGGVTGTALGVTRKSINSTLYLYPAPDSQTNGYAYFQCKIGNDWFGRVEVPRPAINQTTRLMQVGDYGFGSLEAARATNSQLMSSLQSQFFKMGGGNDDNAFVNHGAGLLISYSASIRAGLFINDANGDLTVWRSRAAIANGQIRKNKVYTDGNTTKDSNGNLKAASPIVKVFADHIENNDESEGVTLKKLHTGIYQLHGVLGLHSDASWGGINGGITIPCGINQLPLVFVKYDVLEKGTPHPFDLHIVEPDEDGDIVLYTSYRPHELPQDIQYERFKLYPEFLRDAGEDEEPLPLFDGKVELTPGALCDIPRGHWIDVRVNMPSNSIYNQKQAEAERLAKIEAERLAQEEAKRAVEEAERAEQEAVERKQYGLDDNSVLL